MLTKEQEALKRELLKRKLVLKKSVQKREAFDSNYREKNRCFFFKPYSWQNRFFDTVRKKNITVVASPNKLGKSASTVNLAISWALGFEPWNKLPDDDPRGIRFRGESFMPSSLGIAPPVSLRITGEDWKHHLGQVIVKELVKWAPQGTYQTRKNEQGVEYLWTWETGSTFELLSYKQESEMSEAWIGHGWVADEPPPQKMFGAMSRGIFLNSGKVVIDMTPLSEVWVLDDLILSGRSDIGVINDLLITANEDLYNDEVARLTQVGLTKDQIDQYLDILIFKNKKKEEFVTDKGRAARNFVVSNGKPFTRKMQTADGKETEMIVTVDEAVNDFKLLRFVQDTDPDETATRLGGKFKALIGRVLKSFKTDVHWIDPFPVPTDWPVIGMIDFHLNKPHAISFHAVDKLGVKFVIHEVWKNLTTEEVADTIIRYVKANALRCERVQIDPLSKGDTNYMRNRLGSEVLDSFTIISDRLNEHGIDLEVASKDKVSGIRNIEAALQGVNGRPTYYIFNTCERHLYEVQRWVYDDDQKPSKGDGKESYDDMMENWYRATLAGLEWEPLRPERLYQPEVQQNAWLGA